MIYQYIICFLALTMFGANLNAQDPPQLIMEADRAVAVSFAIVGNPNSWNVYKENSPQPLAGRGELNNNMLIFRPVVAFQPSLIYVVKRNGKVIYTFTPPNTEQSKPIITHIYPTSDTLPANLLKFYVQFSQPMAEGNPYGGIHLVDSSGDTLNNVFLEQLPALWNRSRTVLSLWLDPGRIKRDLNLNKKFGNPLRESQNYHLVVDTTLKSSRGTSLQSTAQKKFTAVTADRVKPEPETWELAVPQKGTTLPLVIYFNEAMDYQSTYGRLSVLINEKPIKGASEFKDGETEWVFTPTQPWKKGTYTLRADARMEDLAGNNLNRLFDRDINNKNRAEKSFYTISFEVQ